MAGTCLSLTVIYDPFFLDLKLANLSKLEDRLKIVEQEDLDQMICNLAVARGYKLQPIVSDEAKLVTIEDHHLLQKEAAENYKNLKMALLAETGIDSLRITSAYRNPNRQKDLFASPLQPSYEIKKIKERLRWSAPPGFSRHQTGYALDLQEGDLFLQNFRGTKTEIWLSENNYKNARRFGFLPSYPADIENQGPDPESWEYIYVGSENAERLRRD